MTKFEEWVKVQRNLGTTVNYLEVDEGAKLVQTSSSYIAYGMVMNNPPVYHIWANDKLYKKTSNYDEAYRIWNREICCKAM